jgi:hypothetical protein
MCSGTQVPIFRRNILLPASSYTDYDNNIWYNDGGNLLFRKLVPTYYDIRCHNTEDNYPEGSIILRSVGTHLPDYIVAPENLWNIQTLEAPYSCETLVPIHQTTQCDNPEYTNVSLHRYEDLESYVSPAVRQKKKVKLSL